MTDKTAAFPFRRGSNLGGWFSQANVLDAQHLASRYRREHIARLPDLSPRQAELRDPAWREQLMLFSGLALGYERMERWFKPVADFARRTGAPVYCTEFGCWDPAPPASQLNWFRDSLRLFQAHEVAWAQWEYGCRFERDGRPKPPLTILFEQMKSSTSS